MVSARAEEDQMLDDDIQRLWRADWDRSGWSRYFPAEGRFVWHALCNAAQQRHAGSLGRTLVAYLAQQYPDIDIDAVRIMDFPLLVPVTRRSRRRIQRHLNALGHAYPCTIGEVASVGERLGLYRQYRTRGQTHWRPSPALPLPAEVLTLSSRQQQHEDHLRWRAAAGFLGQEIVSLLNEDGRPARTVTSIERLAVRLDHDTITVREGLCCLMDGDSRTAWGGVDMRAYVYDASGRLRPSHVDGLDGDEPFVLQANWRRLSRRYHLAKTARVA